jgi:hypothetical protein
MTRCLKVLLSLLLLLGAAAPAFAEYRTIEVEKLSITIDTEWAAWNGPGYFPIRLDITNLGDNREIRIVGTEQRWFDFYRRRRVMSSGPFGSSSQMGTSNFSQLIRLKRGDRVKLTIPVPIVADNENISIRLFENNRPIEGFVSYSSMQSAHDASETATLIVTEPGGLSSSAPNWLRSYPAARRGYYTPPPTRGGTAASTPRMDFMLEPSRLPSSWLGYTAIRAVVLGPVEWAALTAQQKDAILAWTASGGDLFLADAGLETILPQENRAFVIKTTDESFNNYYLGHIHLMKSADVLDEAGFRAALAKSDIAAPFADWTLPANRAMDFTWIASKGFRLPIPGVGGIPTKAFLSMLVMFTVVIGPLNYLYLWRKKQQVMLVVTVPLISLLFIGVLTGYALFGEGFGVRGRAITFTLLDQVTKHAATRSSVSLYAGGMAPSGGLNFPSQLAIYPLGQDGLGWRGQPAMDFTDSQRFSSGLLDARSPTNFDQIGFGPARERLNFERTGNGLSVVNGLGSQIKQLYYRDHQQIYVLNGTLDAGGKGSLQQGTLTTDFYKDALKAGELNPEKFRMLIDTQPNGSYLAVLEKSPFWDSGVANLQELGSFHLVYGHAGALP